MTKLKTLKELDFVVEQHRAWHEDESNSQQSFEQNLEVEKAKRIKELCKQEAIKWIKYFKKINQRKTEELKIVYPNENYESHICDENINWIKYFFNITEEDLK